MDPGDERVTERADGAPPEEQVAGTDDPAAQAAAVLAESEERQLTRDQSAGAVEHRVGEGSPATDR